LETLARAHGIALPRAISGQSREFRLRARLAIRGRLNSPKIGLFASGTHRVVHIPNCQVQHPLINHAAGVVRRALVDARVTSYSETVHLGLARYLQVVIERKSRTAQLVLVVNGENPEELGACVELIQQRLGDQLHSLWFNSNRESGNSILGPTFHRWLGAESVIENFGGANVHYPPGAFGQSNLEIAEAIIHQIRLLVPPGARVTEFYAGSGAIGLSLLPKLKELRLNEVAPASLHGLHLGIAELEEPLKQKVTVFPGTAAVARDAAAGADIIIVDPPRKGLDAELLQLLNDQPPERLLYVSCAVESLLHDCAALTARGKMRLTLLNAFNLFPYTEHVETLALFERA
jgi:23S rRNA (uracil1939-C5)-methyltransferase